MGPLHALAFLGSRAWAGFGSCTTYTTSTRHTVIRLHVHLLNAAASLSSWGYACNSAMLCSAAERALVGGSLIGGIKETQEMLDFCGEHNIVCEIEKIPIDYVNTVSAGFLGRSGSPRVRLRKV